MVVRAGYAPSDLAASDGAPAVALPPISVIVCTCDRASELPACIDALLAIDYPAFEVVIVDSASASPATVPAGAADRVRIVREEVPGLSRARNRGIGEARFPILAFADDDTRADPHWLRGVAAAFADPAVMAVTGRVEAAVQDTPAQVCFEQVCGGMSKGMDAREFHRNAMTSRQRIGVQQVGVGANMAFRRQTLAAVGGFDAVLGAGTPARGGEDLEMFHRVLAAGMRLRYEPDALVFHRHRAGMDALRRQLFDAGCAFGVYLIRLVRYGRSPARPVIGFALRVWIPWLLGRFARRGLRQSQLPWSLLRAHLAGALHAPTAYRAAVRDARAHTGVTSGPAVAR